MNIKKVGFLLVLIILCSGILFANSLEIIDLSSSVYNDVDSLYLLEGKSPPLFARPWSNQDVNDMLSNVNPETEQGRAIKEKLLNEVNNKTVKKVVFNYDLAFFPNIILHTNTKDFTNPKSLVSYKSLDSKLLDASLLFTYSNNLALFMNFDIGTAPIDLVKIDASDINNKLNVSYKNPDIGDSVFVSNIPFVNGGIDFLSFPSRAYASFGNSFFRLNIGKDKIKWGNGVMGDMAIGNTLPYHNYISATFTGSPWFGYQLLADFFTPFDDMDKGDRTALSGAVRFMLGHRFEFSLFKNKFNFALNDLVMYYSATGYIHPEILNPMAFLHNGYIAGNSNSLATIEMEYTFFNGFSIYGELGIDDFAMPTEPQPPEDGSTADGLGFLLGARYYKPYKTGFFKLNGELVYTTPFMYHRGDGNGGNAGYNFYFVSSERYFSNGVCSLSRYLSFPFGSDAIASLFSLTYDNIDLYTLGTKLFFMAHGIINEFSRETQYNSSSNNVTVNTPSSFNPFDSSEVGEPRYTFLFNLNGSYKPYSFLKLMGSVDFITIWAKSEKAKFDCQLNLGIKLSYGN